MPGSSENHRKPPADRRVTGTVLAVEREFIRIEVDGREAHLDAWELMLDVGETPSQRYAVGDTFDAFAFQMEPDPKSGVQQFSIRRADPYPDALNRLKVGAVVNATVVNTYNAGIELDIAGVRGDALFWEWELPLATGESPHDRYQPGDAIEQLFVWQIDHDVRGLYLSVRRNAPGYVEALDAYSVGYLVFGVVTGFQSNGGLWLDVDGVIGSVSPDELVLDDGQSALDRYAIGDIIGDLFVWQVDHHVRALDLSVRRSAPAYAEALAAYGAGEVVSGVITALEGNGGLRVNVGGVFGGVSPWNLSLADGASAQDRYAIGDPVDGLFVWQVNHDVRGLDLSVRRSTHAYVEALTDRGIGEVVSGVVTQANEWGIWLDTDGVVGWIPASELALDEGESLRDRYADNQPVKAQIWRIDQTSRTAILSVRRLHPDFIEEPIESGETINGIYLDSPPGGIRVLAAGSDLLVRRCELSLSIGDKPHFEYGQDIPLVVLAVDSNGQPAALSHRRALPDWQAEVNRLVPGVIVQDAQIIPLNALPPGAGKERTGVDLGPVTGFVDHAELGADDARAMMLEEANTRYSVVIESIDADGEAPIVSNDKFEERWRELAENVSEGDQVQAELRHVSHDNATLDLDLGSGLLATMPADQLPTTETPAKPHIERIGETYSVLVTRKDESARAITVEHRDQPIERLIRQGESEKLEFKATLRRSPRTGETDAAATFGVMKSIVGFLNSWDGGTLLVGVNDRGSLITGPADEVGTMAIDGFANEDEMARALKDLIKNRMGASVFEWLTISFTDFRNSRILRIDCEPADDEVWLKGGKNGKSKEEEFFLRTPAATDPLNGRELVNYIKRRFHGTRTVDN